MKVDKREPMKREQGEQRALELYPYTGFYGIHEERRAAYLRCYDDMQKEMLTEADLVSFGNFLLKDRSEGNYLMSNNLVTHADLENWKGKNNA